MLWFNWLKSHYLWTLQNRLRTCVCWANRSDIHTPQSFYRHYKAYTISNMQMRWTRTPHYRNDYVESRKPQLLNYSRVVTILAQTIHKGTLFHMVIKLNATLCINTLHRYVILCFFHIEQNLVPWGLMSI